MRVYIKTDYTTTTLVPLADAKQHLRIGGTYDDTNVTRALETARKEVEADLNKSILNTVYTMKLDYFPSIIYLPYGRIQSVASVKYTDSDGNEQTLVADTDYKVVTGETDARIVEVNGWPTDINQDIKSAVEVEFTAGYGTASNAETKALEMAILLKLSQVYYNLDLPVSYENIINKNRLYTLAWYENLNRQSIQLR
jgi:uncharacterized phiE125 gp8 family phage protein